MTFQEVVPKFENVRQNGNGSTAKCPAHDDAKNSLSVSRGNDGKTMLYCHAGCSVNDICAAIGIEVRDLFESADTGQTNGKAVEVRAYPYRDEHGALLYENVRFDPKNFKQRHYEGGRAIWGLNGTRRVPYRLPELLEAIKKGATDIFLTEGEKDVDNLRALGLTATALKSGSTVWQPHFNEFITGLNLTLLRDHDKAGVKLAQDAAKAIGASATVKIVDLFESEPLPDKHGKDVTDWLQERRNTGLDGETIAEELATICEASRGVSDLSTLVDTPARQLSKFTFTPLSDFLNEPEEDTSYIWADTLITGGFSICSAKPKVGKSTVARNLVVKMVEGDPFLGRNTVKGRVLYLCLEEKRGEVRKHFKRLGVSSSDILIHTGTTPENALDELRIAIAEHDPVLAVIDPLSRVLRVKDFNDYAGMARGLEPFIDLARKTGCHILALHHDSKMERSGGDALLGSTALFGAVDCHIQLKKREGSRTIATTQRTGEDLPDTVIELDAETGVIGSQGDLQSYLLFKAKEAVRNVMPVGNRTSMTDALGTLTYEYDSLSQMTGETRVFSDEDTGFTDDTVALSYTYTIGGQLKSYSTPFESNLQINLTHDRTGRLSGVSATSGSGSYGIASNPQYRAWGALKHLEYANGVEMTASGFNDRLQATEFEVKKDSTGIIEKSYEFNNDGSLAVATDGLDTKFHRAYSYDHQGRTTKAKTGAEALPYRNTYQYDAFGHRNSVTNRHFGNEGTQTFTYVNNRISGKTYDADGNFIFDSNWGRTYDYDAAGRIQHTEQNVIGQPHTQELVTYDGNGAVGKVVTSFQEDEDPEEIETTYRIRSTPLGGQVIFETGEGVYVYAGGAKIATGSATSATWHHSDPSMKTLRSAWSGGTVLGEGQTDLDWDKHELDPDAKSVGLTTPWSGPPPEPYDLFGPFSSFSSMINGQYHSFNVDNITVPIDYVFATRLQNRHGSLGLDLLELSRAWSAHVTVLYPNEQLFDFYSSLDSIPTNVMAGINQGELNAYWTFSNWSGINLLVPQQQTQVADKPVPFQNMDGLRNELNRRLGLNDGECRKKLNQLLDGLDVSFKNKNLVGIDALAESFLRSKNNLMQTTSGRSGYDRFGTITMNVSPNRGHPQISLMETIGLEFIHELVHAAKRIGFFHEDIVRTISNMEGIDFDKLNAGQLASDASPNGPNDSSLYEPPMNFWLQKYCGGDSKGWDNLVNKYRK